MAFARFNGLAQDEEGNALPECTIEVRDETTGFLAVIYSDRDGNDQLTNPFTSADPNFFFHVLGGNYRIIARKGPVSRTWRWQPIGTAQAADVESLAINLQSGIIPVENRSDLDVYSPPAPEPGEPDVPRGGVVWGDANPTLNGYYVYDFVALEWTKVRPLPDTLAGLSFVSNVGNVVTVQASMGVDPAAVKAFYLDLEDWENTGPLSVRINGATAIPVHDVNGNDMAAGLATGRLFLSNEGTSLRMIVGGDYMAAVATALQYVTEAQAAAELSQNWAEGAEPGGPGTKSAKEWAEESAEGVDAVAAAIQQVALSAVPVGHIKMRFGPLTPGYFAMGEGGVFDRAANPDLATWLDANGPSLGLTAPQIAAGQLPDWRDYSPRTAGGALGPAVGAKQEDAMQRITGTLNRVGSNRAQFQNPTGAFDLSSGSDQYINSGTSGVSPYSGTIGFNSGNSPGAKVSDSETRVKSFGVRWEIKAFGAFVNQGTADLVAIAVGYQNAVRRDVDQLAQSFSVPQKVNILKNTLQAWELIGQPIVNGSAVASIDWLGLAAYRMLRLTATCLPTTADVLIGARWGNGSFVSTSNYRRQRLTGQASVASANLSLTGNMAFLGDVIGNDGPQRNATVLVNLFNFNTVAQTKWMSVYGGLGVGGGDTAGVNTGVGPNGNNDRLQVLFSSGNIAADGHFVLEGIRG